MSSSPDHHDLIAVGVLAKDLSPIAIARFAGVTLAAATAALDHAITEGVIADDVLDPATATGLIASLPAERLGDIHVRIARHLLREGPEQLDRALHHLESAGRLMPQDELVDLAEQGGRAALSVDDYERARRLLQLAESLDPALDPVRRAERLRDVAAALGGLGLVHAARAEIAKAFDLAEQAGATTLAVDMALRYSYPVDWYAGDQRARALLQRALQLDPTAEQLVQITAARATVEMRIPITPHTDHQVAWITRASVAQPLAEQAVTDAAHHSPAVLLDALLAWRTTHRAPRFLARRREVSQRALDLAQSLRLADRQTDAAIMLAVDALESGDRTLFTQALSVARWVAEEDGNPRLLWHVHTLAAGAAHLEGDNAAAEHHRGRARTYGESVNAPGWVGADLLLMGEEILGREDPVEMSAIHLDEDFPGLANPLGRLGYAYILARTDRGEEAERHLRRAVHQLDEEASYLLVAARAAAVHSLVDIPDQAELLIEVLSPWADHVAVDSNAWWCDGPVSMSLAQLHLRRRRVDLAADYLIEAQNTAQSMGDLRSLGRIERLRRHIPALSTDAPRSQMPEILTRREQSILRLMAEGSTNREIAESLAFSLSTIRADTTAIYRKLRVKGRAEAVAAVISRGLV